MRDPNKLLVLQQSRALAVSIYRLTASFPQSERLGLTAQMRRSAVAVGSNIEPERNLQIAASELRNSFSDVRFSPWYRNCAAGFAGDDFVNFVVELSTILPVHELISKLHAIEELCGRPRKGLEAYQR